jgi:hypothetical protein
VNGDSKRTNEMGPHPGPVIQYFEKKAKLSILSSSSNSSKLTRYSGQLAFSLIKGAFANE